MNRVLVANLDYEFGLQPKPRKLPKQLSRRLGKTATVLRVFSPDVLVVPFPFNQNWIVPQDGLMMPNVRQLKSVSTDDDQVMYWAQEEEPSLESFSHNFSNSYSETAWHCPRTSVANARKANDKVFCHELQRKLGTQLPKSKIILHQDQLQELGEYPSWVLKSRYGVAGRNRVLGRFKITEQQEVAIQKLLQESEALILEPWLQRTQDYGVTGFLSPDRVWHTRVHTLKVDGRGTFCGIDTDQDAIDSAITEELTKAFHQVGEILLQEDYVGPFGIDAFTYQGENGDTHIHPVTEINARMTFGHVAQAYSDAFERPVELNFGHHPAPENAVLITAPDEIDPSMCWLV